jgi:hypothetical protein
MPTIETLIDVGVTDVTDADGGYFSQMPMAVFDPASVPQFPLL